jgi:antitoxin component of MazEF toxin-antitoxin module
MLAIVKRVRRIGGSRGIILPKTWMDSVERKLGHELTEVELQIDEEITVKPVRGESKRGKN